MPLAKRNGKRERAQWRVVETRIKGNAAVTVSELPLKVPRYSFKVGTAQIDEDNDEIRVGSRLTTFNVEDAVILLEELGKKYVDKREARIEELEEKKEELRKKHALRRK